MDGEELEKFMRRRVVPLLVEDGGRLRMRGTGSIFRFGEIAYFVTARHVLEGADFNKTGIPVAPSKNSIIVMRGREGRYAPLVDSEIWTFGTTRLLAPKEEACDLAVLPLTDERMLEELAKQWVFLGAHDVMASLKDVNEFWVIGYPDELVEDHGDTQFFPMLMVNTESDPGAARGYGANLNVDLVLRYGTWLHTADGELKETPKLQGISGSIVWGFPGEFDQAVGQSPDKLKVAGVEVSFVHSKFIRAKKMNILASILKHEDPEAWQQLASLFGYDSEA